MKTITNLRTIKAQQTGSLAVVLLAAFLAATSSLSGQPIYSTGFEPDAFLADTPLVGQDSWIAPPPFSPDAALVTTDQPRQGKQTVHVLGADLVPQDFISELTGGYYEAIGSYRHPVNYDTGNAQTVRISAHVRVD